MKTLNELLSKEGESKHSKAFGKKIKSPYTSFETVVPGYTVDYQEDNAKAVTEFNIDRANDNFRRNLLKHKVKKGRVWPAIARDDHKVDHIEDKT